MRFITLLLLTAMQLFLTNCNRSLPKNKIDKWFYGLPAYERSNVIVAKLLADDRFQLITLPDTLKNTYVYKAFIKRQDIPSFIGQPDSGIIDFTMVKSYLGKKSEEKSDNFTEVKLLEIEYFFSDSVKIETLYEKSYKDLKTMMNDDHDISTSFNGIQDGVGKDIIYVKNISGSQVIYIIKKTYQSGLKSLELTFKFGDNYKN